MRLFDNFASTWDIAQNLFNSISRTSSNFFANYFLNTDTSELLDDVQWQIYQSWCNNLEHELHQLKKILINKEIFISPYQFGLAFLNYQRKLKNIISPCYYHQALLQLEDQFNRAKLPIFYSHILQMTRYSLKQKLKNTPANTLRYFYNDVVNFIISLSWQKNISSSLDELNYYEELIPHDIYQTVKIEFARFMQENQNEQQSYCTASAAHCKMLIKRLNVLFLPVFNGNLKPDNKSTEQNLPQTPSSLFLLTATALGYFTASFLIQKDVPLIKALINSSQFETFFKLGFSEVITLFSAALINRYDTYTGFLVGTISFFPLVKAHTTSSENIPAFLEIININTHIGLPKVVSSYTTPEGSTIVLATGNSSPTTFKLLQLSANGTLLSAQMISNYSNYGNPAIILDAEDNNIIIGFSSAAAQNSSQETLALGKFTSNGTLLWGNQFINSPESEAQWNNLAVLIQANGNIIAIGAGEESLLISLTANNGDLISKNTYKLQTPYGWTIINACNTNNGIALIGTIQFTDQINLLWMEFGITNNLVELLWAYALDNTYLYPSSTGGIYTTLEGITILSISNDIRQNLLVKFSNYAFEWGIQLASLSPTFTINAVTPSLADNGTLITGNYTKGYEQSTFLAKLDSQGSLTWAYTLGAGILQSVYTTIDGGIIVTGISGNLAEGEDIFIAKLDNNGNIPDCNWTFTPINLTLNPTAQITLTPVTSFITEFSYPLNYQSWQPDTTPLEYVTDLQCIYKPSHPLSSLWIGLITSGSILAVVGIGAVSYICIRKHRQQTTAILTEKTRLIDLSSLSSKKPTFSANSNPTSGTLNSVVLDIKEKKPKKANRWDFAEPDKDAITLKHRDYILSKAAKEDAEKIIELYQKYPVPGYDIKSIEAIHNEILSDSFTSQVKKLQKKSKNKNFAPKWSKTDDNVDRRKKVNTIFEDITKNYKDSNYPAVKFSLTWHGTKAADIESIFSTGYANLALTDQGFFGKGIYSTFEAEYAYRVYSDGTLLVNWTAVFSPYPVIHSDMIKLKGKGNYENYDSHFAPVVPRNPNDPEEKCYFACKPGETHRYTELVLFESSACLPRFLIKLQPTLPKSIADNSQGFFKKTKKDSSPPENLNLKNSDYFNRI